MAFTPAAGSLEEFMGPEASSLLKSSTPSPENPVQTSAPPSAPSAAGSLEEFMGPEAFGLLERSRPPQKAPEIPRSNPAALSTEQMRVRAEGGAPPEYDSVGEPAAVPSRAAMLDFFGPEAPIVSGLMPMPLYGAYKMARAAAERGYKLVPTSGKRGKSDTYHGYGEAMDFRVHSKDGRELPYAEEKKVATELAQQGGWAGLIDEIAHPSRWASGPHFHTAWGTGDSSSPGFIKLKNRHHNDPDYTASLDLPGSKQARKMSDKMGFIPDAGTKRIPAMTESVAKSYGLDPSLFLAQIGQESSFNPSAVSAAGAQGLGQIMPETAKEIAAKHGFDLKEYHKNPHLQLQMAAIYMRDRLDEFGGNSARALAAYNGGPGTVRQFIDQGTPLPAETRDYVYKIMSQRFSDQVKSEADAVEMVRAGTGPKWDAKAHDDMLRNNLKDAQVEHLGFLDWFAGNFKGAYEDGKNKAGYKELISPDKDDPMSWPNRFSLMAREVLDDFSVVGAATPLMAKFGPEGMLETLKKTEATKSAVDTAVLDPNTEWYYKLAATGAPFGLRAAATTFGFGMLAKGLKMIPKVGKVFSLEQTFPGVVPGASFGSNVKNLLVGSSYEGLFSSLAGHMAIGGTALGGHAISDYIWETMRDNKPIDTNELFARGKAGAFMGGAISLMLGMAMPATLGLYGTALGRITGTPVMNSAGEAVLQEMDKMGFLKKGAMAALVGGGMGGATAAVVSTTGIPQTMLGHEISPWEGVKMGAEAGLSLAVLKHGMDWAGVSKYMANSPHLQAFLGSVRKTVQKIPEAITSLGVAAMRDEIRQANAVHHEQVTNGSIEHGVRSIEGTQQTAAAMRQQAVEARQQILDNFSKKSLEVQQLEAIAAQVGKAYPEAEQHWSELQQVKQASAQAVQAAQSTPGFKPEMIEKIVEPVEKKTAEIEARRKASPEFDTAFTKYSNIRTNQARASGELQELSQATTAQRSYYEQVIQTFDDLHQGLESMKQESQAKREVALNGGNYETSFKEVSFVKPPNPMSEDFLDRKVYERHAADVISNLMTKAAAEEATGRTTGNVQRGSQFAVSNLMGARLGDSAEKVTEANIGYYRNKLQDLEARKESVAEHPSNFITGPDVRTKMGDSAIPWTVDPKKAETPTYGAKVPASVGKNLNVAALDAEAVLHDALNNGVSPDAIMKKATEFGDLLITSPNKVLIPSWDGAAPDLDVAGMAQLAINHGDTHLPVFLPADAKANPVVKERVGKAKQDSYNRELLELQTQVKALQSVRSDWLPSTSLVESVPGETGPLAYGANLANLGRPEALLPKIEESMNALNTMVKEKNYTGLPPDMIQQGDALLQAGIYPGGAAAKTFLIKNGVDSAKATKMVTDYNTAFHVAEIKRQQWMHENYRGTYQRLPAEGEPQKMPQEFVMLSRLRDKYIRDIPDSPQMSAESAIEHLLSGRPGGMSAETLRAYNLFNRELADMLKTDGFDPIKNASGFAPDHWKELLIDIPKQAAHLTKEWIIPETELLQKSMQSKVADLKEKEAWAKFQRELHDGLEDPKKFRELRDKYASNADAIHRYADGFYRLRDVIDRLRQANPVNDPAQSFRSTLMMINRFPRVAASLAVKKGDTMTHHGMGDLHALVEGKSLSMIEQKVEAVEGQLRQHGIDNPEDFAGMSANERMRALHGDDWAKADPADIAKKQKEAAELGNWLLFKDPITDPMHLLGVELHGFMKGAGLQKFLQGLMRFKHDDGNGNVVSALEQRVKGSNPTRVTWKNFQGKTVTEFRKTLGEYPMFRGLRVIGLDGRSIDAKDLDIHPGMTEVMEDYIGAHREISDAGWWDNWQKAGNVLRQGYLVGGIVPFMRNMTNSIMMDAVNRPMKYMNVATAGAEYMVEHTPAGAKMQAARAGLNLRTLDRFTSSMMEHVADMLGPVYGPKTVGLGDPGTGVFLTSLDPGHPGQAAARAQLGKATGAFSDVMSAPVHLDNVINNAIIFDTVQSAMIAGHRMRAFEIFMTDKNLRNIKDPELRWRSAEKMSADIQNRQAGAMPALYAADPFRKAIFATNLAPSWWMSKAYTIVDGLDAMTSLANQKITGSDAGLYVALQNTKIPVVEWLARRRPFEMYRPEARNGLRERMAISVAGQLAAMWVGTQAMQFAINGSFTTNHPADKIFHLHYAGNYYNSPLLGSYVRDIMKFVEKSKLYGSARNLAEGAGIKALGNARDEDSANLSTIGSAIAESILGTFFVNPIQTAQDLASGKVITKNDQGFISSLLDVTDYIQKKQFPSIDDYLGMGDKSRLTDLIGFGTHSLRDLAGNTDPEMKAKMLTSKAYALRQHGMWESAENYPRSLHGAFAAKERELRGMHITNVRAHLLRAKNSGSSEEFNQEMAAAYRAYLTPIPVMDPSLKSQPQFANGYRMNEQTFNNLKAEVMSPTYSVLKHSSGPAHNFILRNLIRAGNMDQTPVGDDQGEVPEGE